MPSLHDIGSDHAAPVAARRRPFWARSDVWLTATLGVVFTALEIAWLAAIVVGVTMLVT